MSKTRFHVVHMLSGIVIAVLLGAHMVVLHLDGVLGFFGFSGPKPTSWEAVISRSTQVTWAGIYIALLAFVLYHALYGLRGVIVETASSQKTERAITWAFIIVGIVIFIWGSYVPIAMLSS